MPRCSVQDGKRPGAREKASIWLGRCPGPYLGQGQRKLSPAYIGQNRQAPSSHTIALEGTDADSCPSSPHRSGSCPSKGEPRLLLPEGPPEPGWGSISRVELHGGISSQGFRSQRGFLGIFYHVVAWGTLAASCWAVWPPPPSKVGSCLPSLGATRKLPRKLALPGKNLAACVPGPSG